MADFGWKETLRAVAPGLATAFGGPLAGAAVKILGDKLLGRPDATAEDVEAALSSGSLSGEQIVALKAAEQSFTLEMERVYVGDTQNARAQTVELAKAESPLAWGAAIVSTLIVLGYFFCIYRLFIVQIDMPPNVFQLLNVMFGALSLAFGQVCNYWLGSSAGSKRASDSIRKIAEQAGR
jgi:hypothetical protein